jgi:hypothetical protein
VATWQGKKKQYNSNAENIQKYSRWTGVFRCAIIDSLNCMLNTEGPSI